MSSEAEIRAARALVALDCIPPSLRDTLAQQAWMRDEYGIRTDSVLTIGEFVADLSEVSRGIRAALSGSADETVRDTDGNQWAIESHPDSASPTLALAHGKRRVDMNAWLTRSPDKGARLRCLEAVARDVCLPRTALESWRQLLRERSLNGEEVLQFLNDVHDTPQVQEQFLAEATRMDGLNSRLVAPSSRTYFERLVGPRGDSDSIRCHAAGGARERLAELADCRPYRGFLQSLYMAAHPHISAQIELGAMSSDELVRVFEFLLQSGDRLSQLGAIETGLRVSSVRPEVAPLLTRLMEVMRDDDAAGSPSGFSTYSTLYVLVFSHLSGKRLLDEDPPFYRRLAALAQAGLIQRQLVAADITLTDSAFDSSAWEYVVRSLVDLRIEPRRQPTLALSVPLRSHFLGRIVRAAARYENDLDPELLADLRRSACHGGIHAVEDALLPYLPGPLEEAEENRELPAESAETIQTQLEAVTRAKPADFTLLSVCLPSYNVGTALAQSAADALRRSEHRLVNVEHRSQLRSLFVELASVAATTRSHELADTLRIVTKRYRHDPEFPLAVSEAIQIYLSAAASREDLSDWTDFVGDFLTELAFGDLQGSDGQLLLSYLQRLCEIVPELWATCGKAEAALRAFNGSVGRSAETEDDGARP